MSHYSDPNTHAGLTNFPPLEKWHDWTELDAKA